MSPKENSKVKQMQARYKQDGRNLTCSRNRPVPSPKTDTGHTGDRQVDAGPEGTQASVPTSVRSVRLLEWT